MTVADVPGGTPGPPDDPARRTEPRGAHHDPAGTEGLDDSRLRALGIDPFSDVSDVDSFSDVDSDAGDHRSAGDHSDAGDRSDASVHTSVRPTGDRDREPVADTPMWLSHHWPADYDRCVVVGGLHVCRRCLVLYPLALVAGVAISIGSWWDHRLDPWVLWLFPLPGVIEFVLDNLRLIAYRPVRQMVLSAGGALAAGVGYVRYLDHTTDPLAWSVLAVYTAVCLSAAVVGGLWRQRSRAAPGDVAR